MWHVDHDQITTNHQTEEENHWQVVLDDASVFPCRELKPVDLDKAAEQAFCSVLSTYEIATRLLTNRFRH